VCKFHLRIQGAFWIVCIDGDGMYLVPHDGNNDYFKVYQALGVADTLWGLAVHNDINGNALRGIVTLVACSLFRGMVV